MLCNCTMHSTCQNSCILPKGKADEVLLCQMAGDPDFAHGHTANKRAETALEFQVSEVLSLCSLCRLMQELQPQSFLFLFCCHLETIGFLSTEAP